ncbi:hypothetical protein EGW08_011712 [Elysia chlorotica]|uniref:Uncharacterized protein n=1 Tax=Elysia chlorotica TaxID=188477 RepID=A0A433TG08_ELYCH|nr:hypothetical protein EGW08_011712 [Elysia chlorotica]
MTAYWTASAGSFCQCQKFRWCHPGIHLTLDFVVRNGTGVLLEFFNAPGCLKSPADNHLATSDTSPLPDSLSDNVPELSSDPLLEVPVTPLPDLPVDPVPEVEADPLPCHTPDPSQKLPQKFYNCASKFKNLLRKKKASPSIHAHMVKNLANTRTPEKRRALDAIGLFKEKAKKTLFSGFSRPKARRPKLKEDRVATAVKVFYTREDISRILPHKQYSTRHGPAFVMNVTMLLAFRIFKEENSTTKVGYTKFTTLRPRIVRKLVTNATHLICLSKQGGETRVPVEGRLLGFMLCPKPESSKWHKPECLKGSCVICHNNMARFETLAEPICDDTIVKSTHFAKTQMTLHHGGGISQGS